MEIKFFRTENGLSTVENFIKKLSSDNFKKVERAINRVEEQQYGLANLFKSEYLKKLEKDIYEIRPGNFRILFTLRDDICWLLHIFFKKSNKTPDKDLKVARQRKNIIYNNYNK